MNYVKRAVLSIVRRRGKSLILFAVVFILGNILAGAVAIRQATSMVEDNVKYQLGASVTIDVNVKAIGVNREVQVLSLDLIEEIAQGKEVKKF